VSGGTVYPWNRGGISKPLAGVITAVLILIGLLLAFRGLPFQGGYELKAVFADTANVGLRSPVRIAGVDVGRVTKVEAAGEDSTAALVTMELDDEALPIRSDAELKIRPRIFLEGNFFVDLEPGTPQGRQLDSGDTVPMTQTSAPVQLDQVLSVLKEDARADLQTLVQGYGEAVSGEPTAAEDATQDPLVRGKTAGEAGNLSLKYAPGALRGLAVVNQALLGSEPHDLSKLIRGGARVAAELNSREAQLQDLITNFNVTTAALAAEQDDLRATVRALPQLLDSANPAFDSLNAAFPPTRAFAREIMPGVEQTAATIDAAFPWVRQTRKLVSPAELQGLVRLLRPATADLAAATDGTVTLLPQVDLVDRCLIENVLPTGDVVIQDPPLTTGVPNYKEFFQTLVGLSGESQNFDGNGPYTRFQPGGGAQTVSTGAVPGIGSLFGNAVAPPLGSRPARPAQRPPYNRTALCHRQQLPDLNSARLGGGP
jgi:phospholipid/cholesterol/gamma-HCH transport system substrate-binding protein